MAIGYGYRPGRSGRKCKGGRKGRKGNSAGGSGGRAWRSIKPAVFMDRLNSVITDAEDTLVQINDINTDIQKTISDAAGNRPITVSLKSVRAMEKEAERLCRKMDDRLERLDNDRDDTEGMTSVERKTVRDDYRRLYALLDAMESMSSSSLDLRLTFEDVLTLRKLRIR